MQGPQQGSGSGFLRMGGRLVVGDFVASGIELKSNFVATVSFATGDVQALSDVSRRRAMRFWQFVIWRCGFVGRDVVIVGRDVAIVGSYFIMSATIF